MASPICKGCDFYKPQYYRVLGRECAAFGTCTENDRCGIRIPPLPRDDSDRFSRSASQNTEPQTPAEVEGH